MKKIVVFISICLVIVGCTNINKKNYEENTTEAINEISKNKEEFYPKPGELFGTREEGMRKVEKYLEAKYGKEFVCEFAQHETSSISPGATGEVFRVYAKEDKDKIGNYEFEVRSSDFTKTGTWTYQDGYFTVYGREKYTQYVEDIVKEVMGDKEYYVGIEFFPFARTFSNNITPETEIEDIFDLSKDTSGVMMVDHQFWIPEEELKSVEDYNDINYKIAKKIKEGKLLGSITIFIVKNSEKEKFLEHKDFILGKINTEEMYKKYYKDMDRDFLIKVYQDTSVFGYEYYEGLKTINYILKRNLEDRSKIDLYENDEVLIDE